LTGSGNEKSCSELARRADVSRRTIQRAEAAGNAVAHAPRDDRKIKDALEAGGIEFLQAS
jgi:hypothetical protein